MRLYLDVCALNRPYDDQAIDRNRLEAEAIMVMIGRASRGKHMLVTSDVIDFELSACPDREKAELVSATLRLAGQRVVLARSQLERAGALRSLGFRRLDAMHLACAESAGCDYFISTDDRLIRRAARYRSELLVGVINPLVFVTEVEP